MIEPQKQLRVSVRGAQGTGKSAVFQTLERAGWAVQMLRCSDPNEEAADVAPPAPACETWQQQGEERNRLALQALANEHGCRPGDARRKAQT